MLPAIYKITLKELMKVEIGGDLADKKRKLLALELMDYSWAIILQLAPQTNQRTYQGIWGRYYLRQLRRLAFLSHSHALIRCH